MNVREIKRKVVPILKKFAVTKAAIFGSVVRGENRKNSDVDILVEIENKRVSLLDFVGMKLEIEDVLGKKVDLVEYCTIKPLIRKRILSEQVVII